VEQKETSLTEALKKAADFIRATEACIETSDEPRKNGFEERNLMRAERRWRNES